MQFHYCGFASNSYRIQHCVDKSSHVQIFAALHGTSLQRKSLSFKYQNVGSSCWWAMSSPSHEPN